MGSARGALGRTDTGVVVTGATLEDPQGRRKVALDPGEEAVLRLDLRNDGDEPAEGVSVTASTEVELTFQGPVAVDSILPHGTATVRLPIAASDEGLCGRSLSVWTEAGEAPMISRGVFLFDVGREPLYRFTFEEGPQDWAVNPYGTDPVRSTGFVRAAPSGGGLPPIDATREGRYAFVTGPAMDAGWSDDTDGVSTLVSPPLDLSTRSGPVLRFSYWVYANDYLRDVREEDDLLVEASSDGGVTWLELVRLWDDSLTWKRFEVPLEDYLVPWSRTRIRFTARDRGPDNLVEVAVDDVEILVPTPTCGGAAIEPPTVPEEGCGCAVGGPVASARSAASQVLSLAVLLLFRAARAVMWTSGCASRGDSSQRQASGGDSRVP